MAMFISTRKNAVGQSEETEPKANGVLLHRLMLYSYLPLTAVYLEILLRLLCGYRFFIGLAFALLRSLSVGFLFAGISGILPNRKLRSITSGVMLVFLGFIFALEYFMYSAYRVFMSVETILFGAGNVASEFTGTVLTTVISGIPKIIGFSLPLILFIILSRLMTKRGINIDYKRIRCIFITGAALGICLIGQIGIIAGNSGSRAAYYSEYHFDSSSRRLGILTGLGLELRFAIFGSPYEDLDFIPVEQTPQTPTPADPSPDNTNSPVPVSPNNDPASPNNSPASPNNSPSSPNSSPAATDPPVESPDDEPQDSNDFGLNILSIDFDSYLTEDNADIAAIINYVTGLTGSRKNEYTGIFEGKNLIIITAESFSKEAVDPFLTPTLYRLVHNGFYFSDYYQPIWGGSTSSGEFAVLTGIAPVSGVISAQNVSECNMSFTIGNKLMSRGYFSASYHNGTSTFYNRDITHPAFGYSTFTAIGNGMETYLSPVWPASDLEMMQFSLPQYVDNQPFSVYYVTISGHCVYSPSSNGIAEKNWNAFSSFEEMSDPIRAYYACMLELEYAMQYLITTLEDSGIADDTVIVLTNDHYPYGLEKSDSFGTDRDYLSELYGFTVETPADRDHSALIIWSGCLENEYKHLAAEISEPVFSLDILPTLCNLFGLDFDSRLLVGRDVFSDADPLVFWLDRCWKTEFGYYDADTDIFTPAFDMSEATEYTNHIRAVVNNKIIYSDAVFSKDFFNVLFNSLDRFSN